MELSVVQGDIADQDADALVSAAETGLQMRDGVASAVRECAGDPIREEAQSEAPLYLGEVAVTDAYELDAQYVLHAAATPSYGSGQASAESIRAATLNALQTADELSCESLVVPILGTGTAGFEFDEGAHIVCKVIREYEPSSLSDVDVIAYTESEYTYLRQIVDSLRSRKLASL